MKKRTVEEIEELLKGYPDVLTVSQFREVAGIGTQRAYDLVRARKVKGVSVGKHIYVSKQTVVQLFSKDLE